MVTNCALGIGLGPSQGQVVGFTFGKLLGITGCQFLVIILKELGMELL